MKFVNCISTIDSHTAGMPTRLVVSGVPYIPGNNLIEKRQYVIDHMRGIVSMLMDEPRGHRGMRGAILTPPTTKEAHAGVVFIGGNCIPSCGHSTIGVVATMLETGMIAPAEPVTEVVLETPAGLVHTRATVDEGRVVSVSMVNVPAFLYEADVEVNVPGMGRLVVDIAFGGNFNILVNATDIGIQVRPENIEAFIEKAILIKRVTDEKIQVVHPEKPFINRISHVQFYGPPLDPQAHMKNIAISIPGTVDRSPCGSGTCARMSHLFSKGKLHLGETFVHESVIGTLFDGKIIGETNIGNYPAIIPEITGKAFITGMHQFVLDPDDSLKYGLFLGGSVGI